MSDVINVIVYIDSGLRIDLSGDVIQGGVWLVTCPVLRTPKLHYINRLGIIHWKWNVIFLHP